MLYSRPFLEQRIKEEKFRTYRTGSSFSVLLFNPFRLVSEAYKSKKTAINSLVELLEQETRETDIKGWWDRSTIAILLLDTTRESALVFKDKLASKIQENGLSKPELMAGSPFKIFDYPNGRVPNSSDEGNDKKKGPRGPRDNLNQNCQKISSVESVDRNFQPTDALKKHQRMIKRALDIVLSTMSLIFLSPLFLLCACLIKLDSPGPVFYRQTRVGKHGKGFTFLKFRSMYHNVDQGIHMNHVTNLMNGVAGLSTDGGSHGSSYKLTEDRRVTRLGRFLRRTSIDELPQLINVLKGDMSLVGPRPHPVYEVEQYNLWHSHRLEVTSGITGLGQVHGRFNTGYEDVYRLDLRYLKKRSLILDLKILFETVPVVLSRRGAR